MNVKQTPKKKISQRELNKEKQLTDNIDKISSSSGNDSGNQLKSNQPFEEEEMTNDDKGQNDVMNQATNQSNAPRYSFRGGKRYSSVEEKWRACEGSWLQDMEEDSSDTTQDEEMCQAPAHPSVPVSNRPSQFKSNRSVRQGKSERAKEHANPNNLPPDMSQTSRLSWRKLEQQVDYSDQPSAPKNGSGEPLPPDEVDMTQDDEMSQTSAEWDLNTARLVGLVNDGQPSYFTDSEYSHILHEGSNFKVRYTPAPGANQKARQQRRCGNWRAQQKHQQRCQAVCPTWRSLKKSSKADVPREIRKYMKKLEPTVKELQAKVSKDW